MSLRCPDCGHELPRGHEFRLLRKRSFNCTVCNCPLALDGRGTSALKGAVLISLVVAAVLFAATRSALLAFAAVGAGYILGCVAAAQVGSLGLFRKE